MAEQQQSPEEYKKELFATFGKWLDYFAVTCPRENQQIRELLLVQGNEMKKVVPALKLMKDDDIVNTIMWRAMVGKCFVLEAEEPDFKEAIIKYGQQSGTCVNTLTIPEEKRTDGMKKLIEIFADERKDFRSNIKSRLTHTLDDIENKKNADGTPLDPQQIELAKKLQDLGIAAEASMADEVFDKNVRFLSYFCFTFRLQKQASDAPEELVGPSTKS